MWDEPGFRHCHIEEPYPQNFPASELGRPGSRRGAIAMTEARPSASACQSILGQIGQRPSSSPAPKC